jgi:hypothetical protein
MNKIISNFFAVVLTGFKPVSFRCNSLKRVEIRLKRRFFFSGKKHKAF